MSTPRSPRIIGPASIARREANIARMSTTEGTVGVSITAGHLTDAGREPTRIGKQLWMGTDAQLAIHITPDIAAQWIQVLTPIANEESN